MAPVIKKIKVKIRTILTTLSLETLGRSKVLRLGGRAPASGGFGGLGLKAGVSLKKLIRLLSCRFLWIIFERLFKPSMGDIVCLVLGKFF